MKIFRKLIAIECVILFNADNDDLKILSSAGFILSF